MKEPDFKEVCKAEEDFCHQFGHEYCLKSLNVMWKEIDRDAKWNYHNELCDAVSPITIDEEAS
jgi:hypothetical protein